MTVVLTRRLPPPPLQIAELLIDHGANIEAAGDLGNRPLHLAASGSHEKVGGQLTRGLAIYIYIAFIKGACSLHGP